MKAVLLLAVLTVVLLLPEEGEAGWFRDAWTKVKNKAKDGWRKVKDGWRKAKGKIADKLQGRDLDEIDLDKDGAIDQSELEAMIGERHARDLLDLMDAGPSISLEEFDRKARDLDELEEEDE